MRHPIKHYFTLIILSIILFISCKSNAPVVEESEDIVLKGIVYAGSYDDSGKKHAHEALEGASISIIDTDAKTLTAIDGRFILNTNKSLPVRLKISSDGYESLEIDIKKTSEDLKFILPTEVEEDEHITYEEIPYKEGSIDHDMPVSVAMKSEAIRVASSDSRSKGMTKASSKPMRIDPGKDIEPTAGLITAAEWNDLDKWEDWKKLLDNQDYNEMQNHWKLFPRSRYSVFVRNKYELPLQDVSAELLDKKGNVLWSGRTDNSGKVELWSDINLQQKSFEPVDIRVVVKGKSKTIKNAHSIESGVNNIEFDSECSNTPNVDVFFAVDATGSMGDEIRYLQTELQDVISRSLASNTNLQLRTGAVFYRDTTDTYLTKVQPLSGDASSTLDFIAKQRADGGGDYPEAVDAALDEALAQDWSEDAVARIIFLLLDAPPHHNENVLQRIQDQVKEAAQLGIKIIPITASGINRQTEFLMKFMSIATNGTYVFITDHSGIGNPHLDPVVQDYEVEKLNDLLVRLLYHYTKSNGCNANTPGADGITFYPNPAIDYVTVNSKKPIRTLKLLSNSGKLLKTQDNLSAGSNQIDLSGLIDGIYTIQCLGDDIEYAQTVVVIKP